MFWVGFVSPCMVWVQLWVQFSPVIMFLFWSIRYAPTFAKAPGERARYQSCEVINSSGQARALRSQPVVCGCNPFGKSEVSENRLMLARHFPKVVLWTHQIVFQYLITTASTSAPNNNNNNNNRNSFDKSRSKLLH